LVKQDLNSPKNPIGAVSLESKTTVTWKPIRACPTFGWGFSKHRTPSSSARGM